MGCANLKDWKGERHDIWAPGDDFLPPLPEAENVTLNDERARLRIMCALPGGTISKTCERRLQIYKKRLDWKDHIGLNEMLQNPPEPGQPGVHLAQLLQKIPVGEPPYNLTVEQKTALTNGGGVPTDLLLYGLISRVDLDPEDHTRKTSGLFNPTTEGREFHHEERAMPAFLWTLNNEIVGVSLQEVMFRDIRLGTFDFSRIMGGA